MLIVGLTGGIGSGKSTVAAEFARLGVPLIDADIVAREVVVPASEGLRQVVAQFGESVLQDDGQLDRRALRAIVFADEAQRRRLEAILHPLINERIRAQLDALTVPYALLVSPLLLETSQRELVDRILVVDCDEEIQISRTAQRDKCAPQQVRAIIDAQIGRAARLQAADDVLHNDRDVDALIAGTRRLHQRYLQLARQAH